MSSIQFNEAEALANLKLKELEKVSGYDLVIINKGTRHLDGGWIFFYNTREFVETGEIESALGGNGPLFVTKDGSLFELRTDLPWSEAVKQIKPA